MSASKLSFILCPFKLLKKNILKKLKFTSFSEIKTKMEWRTDINSEVLFVEDRTGGKTPV